MKTLTMRAYKNTGYDEKTMPKIRKELEGKAYEEFNFMINPDYLFGREKHINFVVFKDLLVDPYTAEEIAKQEAAALEKFKDFDFFEFLYIDEKGDDSAVRSYYYKDKSYNINSFIYGLDPPHYAGIYFKVLPDYYLNCSIVPIIDKRRKPW